MMHEAFPTPGFEFMDEPATDEQKELIVHEAARIGVVIEDGPDAQWPAPVFSRYDAARMLDAIDDIRINGANSEWEYVT